MKIGNIGYGDTLKITQTHHGKNQNLQAFDFGISSGPAPCDGYILSIHPIKGNAVTGYPWAMSYFYFGNNANKWKIEYVHATPVAKVGTFIKSGQPLWTTTWHHGHITMLDQGVWHVIIDYIIRTIKLTVGSGFTAAGTKKWTDINTYTDRQILPYDIILPKFEMVILQQAITCKSIATTNLNIRQEPSSKSKEIGELAPNTQWQTKIIATGEPINGNTTWYGVNGGYVTGAYVQEISSANDAELQKQLTEANNKIAAQQVIIDNQTVQITDLAKQVEDQKVAIENLTQAMVANKQIVDSLILVNNTK